jgi:hypothetical protein
MQSLEAFDEQINNQLLYYFMGIIGSVVVITLASRFEPTLVCLLLQVIILSTIILK